MMLNAANAKSGSANNPRKMLITVTTPGRQSRELQHEVTVSHFLIAKYEVTQTEWRNVMGNDPSRVTGDTHPVERVSWEDCQEACEKLGLSLPTEAQWEYACRAGTQGTFGGTGKLDDMGWYKANSGGKFHTAVGQKEPNGFGLYDMHGNVWEWCQDSFEKEFYSRSEATKRNPCCTSGSKDRVMRGGFSFEDASLCRSAHRDSQPQGLRSPAIGFRPSRPLP